MKYKILLPLLISGLFFSACSKDDKTETDRPGGGGDTILETYFPGSTMQIVELAIYTTNDVITDPGTIQGFIDRNVKAEAKSSFFIGMSSVPVPDSKQVLYFLNGNRVHLNGLNMEIVGYRDSTMLISEYTSTPFPVYYTTCASLLARVPEISPYSDCPAGSCGSYRKTYPLLVSGVNYYAPLLTYAVKTNECASTTTELPSINFKSEDLTSKLVAGDSVLIQYAKLPLIKKASE
jgi:hypothetical protein